MQAAWSRAVPALASRPAANASQRAAAGYPTAALGRAHIRAILRAMRALLFGGVVACVACSFPRPPDSPQDVDGPPPDGAADSPIASCKPGFIDFCSEPAPTQALVISGSVTINTDTDARCRVKRQTGAPEICALFFTRFETTAAAVVSFRGSRAVAIVASEEIVLRGVLDLGARTADAPPAGALLSCAHDRAAEADAGGGAGGAGGSFGGRGGDGGDGDIDTSTGADDRAFGGRAAAGVPLTALRGGCTGQLGGSNQNAPYGDGGRGGGAVYLTAPRVSVSGTINVSGAGGRGGLSGQETGGGGGGSGGMALVEGAVVTVSDALLFATGGGGGQGGHPSRFGADGEDGGSSLPARGGSLAGSGGAGGEGAVTSDAVIGASSGSGGGGGGGGVGYLRILSKSATVGAGVTAAPTLQVVTPAP